MIKYMMKHTVRRQPTQFFEFARSSPMSSASPVMTIIVSEAAKCAFPDTRPEQGAGHSKTHTINGENAVIIPAVINTINSRSRSDICNNGLRIAAISRRPRRTDFRVTFFVSNTLAGITFASAVPIISFSALSVSSATLR
jgi:hypothetical protein